MLVAVLVILGIDLIVIVAAAGFVISRKRWVKRQPGVFRGAIRIDGRDTATPKWRRGYGRWVRDVLVWTKAPLLLNNELLAIDSLEDERHMRAGDIKRLGETPTVIRLNTATATVEVVAANGDVRSLRGPFLNAD